jgi:hypothetical protein
MAMGWTTHRSEFEARWGQDFSPLHVIQTGYGAHPATYPMDNRDSFPGVKRPGREAEHSVPTTAEVKKMWIYTPTPSYAFMA